MSEFVSSYELMVSHHSRCCYPYTRLHPRSHRHPRRPRRYRTLDQLRSVPLSVGIISSFERRRELLYLCNVLPRSWGNSYKLSKPRWSMYHRLRGFILV